MHRYCVPKTKTMPAANRLLKKASPAESHPCRRSSVRFHRLQPVENGHHARLNDVRSGYEVDQRGVCGADDPRHLSHVAGRSAEARFSVSSPARQLWANAQFAKLCEVESTSQPTFGVRSSS